MKKIFTCIVLVLCAASAASAESSVWKAQKGDSVMYLGGTFHILRESDYPLPAEFDKAYKASDIVVFETDIGRLHDPSVQEKMLSKAVYADGSTLDKHLSERAYRELSEYCDSSGIPLAALGQLKPSVIMMTLTVVELMKLGATGKGVDQFFYEQAQKDQKAIEGFETVDEQIDHLIAMADGIEDAYVTYSIKEMKTLKGQLEEFTSAWRRGDAGRLDELMAGGLKSGQPVLYKRIITDRNRNWLPRIEAYQKTPAVEFILVGAAHLVGPDGIIESLKKNGYKVEKL